MTNATPAMARLHEHAPVAWPTVPGRLPLTEEAVRRTAGTSDPAVRNLWITQSYADLARRLLDVLDTDQTWCTFAIWASNTAGRSIRGQELPRLLEDLVPGGDAHLDAAADAANTGTSLWRRFGMAGVVQRSHLEHLLTTALAQVSSFIADGNALVYGELAPVFLRMVEALEGGDVPESDGVDAWLDRIAVPDATSQPLVRLAFEHYAHAVCADTSRRRAQHVLTANIAAVLHEQQRLQHDITAALDAGLVDVGDDLCGVLHGWVPSPIRRRIATSVGRRVAVHTEQLWQRIATALLMQLTIPGTTLHLDRDVPEPAHGPLFPEALADVDLPDLRELMDSWDPTGGTGIGCGARDWADLHQRMGYIVNLFRSRQRDRDLTVPPFTTAELAWMVRGEVPPSL